MERVELSDVSREAFLYWKKRDPITAEVMRRLKRIRAQLRNRSVDLAFNPDSVDQTALSLARIKGNIEGIELLLEITFEGVENEE